MLKEVDSPVITELFKHSVVTSLLGFKGLTSHNPTGLKSFYRHFMFYLLHKVYGKLDVNLSHIFSARSLTLTSIPYVAYI